MDAAELAEEPRACLGVEVRPTVCRVARAREGDREALAELLNAVSGRMLTLCLRVLGSQAEAEDAAQEAMIKVSLHLHELERDEQFVSWCWRIAHRICIDRLRKISRRERLAAERGAPALADGEQRIVGRMAVRQILAAMPEDMSEVLILREMEEQTYEDIAARLALPLGTVKSRLSAARERFRRDYLAAMQEDV